MSDHRFRVINVAGARPNFVKMASLMAAFRATDAIEPLLVHTGQHYDEAMSMIFFRDLGIPHPDVNLDVGSGSHAVQTARIMMKFERVVIEQRPDAVLVVGDVNSTIACGLTAVKLGVPLVHVEAGLRSGDRAMPEEINRLLTDAISDLLFCTEQAGVDNLRREGVDPDRVFLVGNVMVDTLLAHRAHAAASPILDRLRLEAQDYAVLTLHRPSNVDDHRVLDGILDAVETIGKELPVVLPRHPRLRCALADAGLERRADGMRGLRMTDPLGHLDFLKLIGDARIVLTDSGGVQEETTVLGVPCVTLRENTERPVTVEMGTNRLAGTATDGIVQTFREWMGSPLSNSVPPLWDGKSAERVAAIVAERLSA